MSWATLFSGETPEMTDSPLETERFGLSVARATVPFGADRGTALGLVRSMLGGSPADLVVLRYPAAYADWFARLLTTGRDLLAADTLVYWRLDLSGPPATAPAEPETEGLGVELDPALERAEVTVLVDDIFGDYTNHYRANPLLDPDVVREGYRDWAARSVVEDHCVTLRRREEVLGLATMETTPGSAEVLLAGIGSAHQGRGLYHHLLAGCARLGADHGAEQLVISTQGHNTGVQRAWARAGLEPVGTTLTLHAIRRGLLASAVD
ncbi:GNAT family N-acetyltransferase [Nocardioides sp.]|uniref:GNAT family N-acetyltransferase n=1 Tax=Nocardioides sp. TaxID=35761 RepID=UPI0027363301|nr:GNAT family N-acetyltransferase [Nocardioides sp.]MDP3891505.1 N-acetyltransferase [Nocardioides sp.]